MCPASLMTRKRIRMFVYICKSIYISIYIYIYTVDRFIEKYHAFGERSNYSKIQTPFKNYARQLV